MMRSIIMREINIMTFDFMKNIIKYIHRLHLS